MLQPKRASFGFLVCTLASLGAFAGCGGSFEAAPGSGSGGASAAGGATASGGKSSAGGAVGNTGGAAGRKSCVVGIVEYLDGSSAIPSADGCNTCSCDNGQLACTLIACLPGAACGGRAGNTCSAKEYCAYAGTGLCGAADAQSTCAPRPQICPAIFAPVCGCDGMTYSSACSAGVAGVGFSTQGECATAGSCTVGNQVYANGTTNIPAPDGCNTCSCTGGVSACTEIGCVLTHCGGFAGNTCAADEYCSYATTGSCLGPDAAGVCKKRPQVCSLGGPIRPLPAAIAVAAPGVCGCNGMSYFDACAANTAGTDVASLGMCAAVAVPF